MRKLLLLLASLGLLANVSLAAEPNISGKPADSTPQNVILISWDGLDRSVVKELLDKEKLPNLAALIKEGSMQEIEIKGHATSTKPSHAVMLTGLAPKTTGVHTNTDYQPIPEGYTIFERVQKHFGGRQHIRCLMVTGKVAHVGGRGPEEIQRGDRPRAQRTPPTGADASPRQQGEPFFLTKKHLDVFDAAQRNASATGPLCLKYLEQFKSPRFLAFLHFSDPDHAGHQHGAASAEYRAAAVACDEWLGKIIAWLKKENLYATTLIYVTTDHGFDMPAGRTHNNAPHSWLVTNDKAVTHGGSIADIPATILARFGVDLDKLEPKLIGQPLSAPADKGAEADTAPTPPTPRGRLGQALESLDLTAEQQRQIRALLQNYQGDRRNPQFRRELNSILTPEQREKLREMRGRRQTPEPVGAPR